MTMNQNTAAALPATPVVCDQCRAAGMAGDPAFTEIADILDFEPVPVRSHAHNWTAEHQRAFIAALALTGSVNQAARSIGRYSAGADRLRKARGGRAFAEAWQAALEIARDREFARVHANLGELGAAASHRPLDGEPARLAVPAAEHGAWVHRVHGDDYDPGDFEDGHAEQLEGIGAIRERLIQARRNYLWLIQSDEQARAAWEYLVGPVDWDKATRFEAQDDEPAPANASRPLVPNLRKPDMLLTAESGFLPDLVGGHDLMAEAFQAYAEEEAEAAAAARGEAQQEEDGQ